MATGYIRENTFRFRAGWYGVGGFVFRDLPTAMCFQFEIVELLAANYEM